MTAGPQPPVWPVSRGKRNCVKLTGPVCSLGIGSASLRPSCTQAHSRFWCRSESAPLLLVHFYTQQVLNKWWPLDTSTHKEFSRIVLQANIRHCFP